MYLVQIMNDGVPGCTYEVDPPESYDAAVELAFKVLKSNKNPNGSLKQELWDEAKSDLDTDGWYDNVFILLTESWEDCPYCDGGCPNQDTDYCNDWCEDVDGLADKHFCEAEENGVPCNKPCSYDPEVCLCKEHKEKIPCSLCGRAFNESEVEYIGSEGDKPRPYCENCSELEENTINSDKVVGVEVDSYLVDLPVLGGTWNNVASFDDKQKAIQWIRENIGHCDDEGNICLITQQLKVDWN